jgi:hypothetical protein
MGMRGDSGFQRKLEVHRAFAENIMRSSPNILVS